jgi:hypothetical protein
MKTIVAFVLGATLVGVTSGVIASDVETYNEENGYWGSPCPVTYGINKPCDQEVITFNEENGYWS